MADQKPEQNKTIDPVEVFRRNVRKMQPRQLVGHLKRRIRGDRHHETHNGGLHGDALAIVLSAVYQSTAPQFVDDNNRLMKTEMLKDFGKINPGIR